MSTIEKTFANGEVIIKEGDIGNSFFQILEGNAGVYKNYGLDDQVKLTVLVPGQYFGEMAVIESYPRSSTVVAESDVKVVEVPADDLNLYFTEKPDEILALMKHLGKRLKELTADYDEAKKILADLKSADKKDDWFSVLIQKHIDWFKARAIKVDKPSAESLRESAAVVSGQGSDNVESYKKGTIIFKQGEVGKCMYIVHNGSVGIYSNYGTADQLKLTELFPVACFGEMGMIAEEARSATAVSETDDTYVEIINPEELAELFKTTPVKIDMILRHLSYRLRCLTYDYFNACKELSETYSK